MLVQIERDVCVLPELTSLLMPLFEEIQKLPKPLMMI